MDSGATWVSVSTFKIIVPELSEKYLCRYHTYLDIPPVTVAYPEGFSRHEHSH
jgi:hypothetical protein